jgi:hypothetical protein
MALLRAAAPALRADDVIAFADQDDIWLPEKLQRGLSALATAGSDRPALYCASLVVVDAQLHKLGETLIHPERCGFPASLTQNIAAGCTIVLNRAAVQLVCASTVPSRSVHDWWCYLVVTAAGGQVLVDDRPVALYRQHDSNCIGVAQSKTRRAIAAVRRGPRAFMNILRQHGDALVGGIEGDEGGLDFLGDAFADGIQTLGAIDADDPDRTLVFDDDDGHAMFLWTYCAALRHKRAGLERSGFQDLARAVDGGVGDARDGAGIGEDERVEFDEKMAFVFVVAGDASAQGEGFADAAG